MSDSIYMMESAAAAGLLWEVANRAKNDALAFFTRSASFVFAMLSFGFLILELAQLIQ